MLLRKIFRPSSLLFRPFSALETTVRQPNKKKVTLIQGDGVYPEILDSVVKVVRSSGAPIEFQPYFLSEVHKITSSELDEVVANVEVTGVCLRGIIATPDTSSSGELDSTAMKFRRGLDLFANVVRAKSHPGIRTRHQNVDMVIIREGLEGEYSSLEHESVPGVVECLKIVTADRSLRIAKFAFDYATRHGRKKVTCVHKANIMKLGDGLFLESCRKIAELYPNIEFNSLIVDATTMELVKNPQKFDVLVMPNLYGDILINLASGLVGGAGVTCGESYSERVACFEPACRHMFSSAAGRNVANPTAMLFSAANLLEHLNLHFYGENIRQAVNKTIRSGAVKTKDLGGHGTTTDFVVKVIDNLKT